MDRARRSANAHFANNSSDTIDGKTSLYEIKIDPGRRIAYRYNVKITKEWNDKSKELTKQTDPGLRTLQRESCFDIIERLFEKTDGFGVKCKYIYDGKTTCFTNRKIQVEKVTRLFADELKLRARTFVQNRDVVVTITPNESDHAQLDYSNLASALVSDVNEQADRSVRTFFEILTSQHLINQDLCQQVTSGCMFDNRTTDLAKGVQMRSGFKKGVRIVGTRSNAKALLVVDMKQSAFFASKKLIDIYNQFVKHSRDKEGRVNFEKFMRGVRVFPSYRPAQTFPFERLTDKSINQYLIDGQSLMDNFAQNKGIQLEHFDLLGVQRTLPTTPNQRRPRRLVYPMEVLNVVPGQLLPTEKLSDEVGRRLLAENSIPAHLRYNYIQSRVESLATGKAAQFLQEFGVKIDLQSNSVEIHQNKQPKIIIGDGKLVTAQPNGSWLKEAKTCKFFEPSDDLSNWIVVYHSSLIKDFVKQFMKKLILIGKHAGMTIEEPKKYCSVRNTEQLQTLFKDAPGNYDFIFHIDFGGKLHRRLKLYEAYYKVLTQQISHETMKEGQQTLKNIVMKLNTKRNGLCYVPKFDQSMQKYSLDNDDLLIIGYDVSHPQSLSPKELFELKKIDVKLENKHPSVVGICANKLASKWAFAGDYFYQRTNQEAVSPTCLQAAVKRIVETAVKNGRQAKRVIVFRDGISEGQFEMAIKEELHAIRQGISDADPTVDSKVTFIVATKNHNKRVFRTKGQKITSSAIGDCVETKIVREDVIEFYLQSHSPVKGVSKMLQLSILVNENQMENTEIRKLVVNLSNLHQICASPTSLPLPIFLADECCKRGMEVYQELYDMRFPAKGHPINFAAEEIKAVGQFLNYDQLTETLGYGTSHLGELRFNA